MAKTCDIDKCGKSAVTIQHHGEPADFTCLPRWIEVNLCAKCAENDMNIRIDAKGGRLIRAWKV